MAALDGDRPIPFAPLRAGDLEVRVVTDPVGIEASQGLRYRVFYEEMAAKPTPEMAAAGRDFDPFDAVADHLNVLDLRRGDGPEATVGTYRLIRRAAAERVGGFYTADEYDITPILTHGGQVLELGRSCIDTAYRNRTVMQLLWRGIAAYVFQHDIALMFGCASFPGTDLDALSNMLSYLHAFHLAPADLRPRALDSRYVDMNLLAADSIDTRKALADLPPLIKGYLRLGGFVGDGAVVDHQFNTTDVCVVVQTDQVTDRYYRHYQRTTAEP